MMDEIQELQVLDPERERHWGHVVLYALHKLGGRANDTEISAYISVTELMGKSPAQLQAMIDALPGKLSGGQTG